MHVPLYEPYLRGNERAYVNDCLNSGWISSRGGYVQRFEQAFGDFVGAEHCTSVCNGTVALHLALLAAGIGPGDEMIVPTLTYIAPVNAIAYVGAKPVFVDARGDTWQMDEAEVASRITPRTRAILAVHLYEGPWLHIRRISARPLSSVEVPSSTPAPSSTTRALSVTAAMSRSARRWRAGAGSGGA